MPVPVFRLLAKVGMEVAMLPTTVMMWMSVKGKASRNQTES